MVVDRLAVLLAAHSLFLGTPSSSSQPASTPQPAANFEVMVTALSAPDAKAREKAAEAIARSGDPRAVYPLIGLLKDPDFDVRRHAALALGVLGDVRAAEPLIQALDGPQREAAAVALGQIGDARAVGPLSVVFGDRERSVRHAAATSLSSLGEPGAILLEHGLAGSKEALERLVNEGHGRLFTRVLAVFDRWHPDSREEVLWAVGDLRDKRTVDFFVGAASNGHPRVRAAAVWGIGRTHPAAAVSLLTRALSDDSYVVREAAAWALGESGDRSSVAPVIGALEDTEPRVRAAAAFSLGKIADPSAAAPLRKALADRDEKVRTAAAYAIAQFLDPATVESLLPLLGDRAPGVRAAAAWSLGKSADQRALEHLVRSLADASPAVRIAAASGLGGFADPRGVAALIDASVDDHQGVREAAAASLGKANEPLGRLLLDRAQGRPVPEGFFGKRDSETSPESLLALNSKHATVRRVAAWYLGERGEIRAAAGLTALSSSWNPRDRVAGLANLRKLKGRGALRDLSSVARILAAPSSLTYFIALTAIGAVLLSVLPITKRGLRGWDRVGVGSLAAGAVLSFPAISPTWIFLGFSVACVLPFLLLRATASVLPRR